jgi:HPt (histidine-containing phosphotransfer) domain-containing protein
LPGNVSGRGNFISSVRKARQKQDWPAPGLLEQLKQDLGAKFVAELVHAFLDQLEATLTAVTAASSTGDLGTVAKEIHSLKGSSRQLAIEDVGTICAQIETLAKENKLHEAQLLIKRLEEDSKAVRRGLEAYLRRLSAEPPVQ